MLHVTSLQAAVRRPAVAEVKKPAQLHEVRFGASLLQDNRYVVDFSMPVVDETVQITSDLLQNMAAEKKALRDTGSIKLVINSPGGSVSHGFKLIGVIRQLDVPVDTIVMGIAASMGAAMALGCNNKGRRFMDRYAMLMIHQPSVGGLEGTTEQIDNYNSHLKQTRNIMDGLISQSTGLSLEKVHEMTSKDTYIYPLKALKEGFVDWIVLSGNRGLNKDSVKNLTDADIEKRDQYNTYDDLPSALFDTKASSPSAKKLALYNDGEDQVGALRKLLAQHVQGEQDRASQSKGTVKFKEDLIVARHQPAIMASAPANAAVPSVAFGTRPGRRFQAQA